MRPDVWHYMLGVQVNLRVLGDMWMPSVCQGKLAPGLSSLRPVLRPRLRWDRSRRCAALGADHHGHAFSCLSVLPA